MRICDLFMTYETLKKTFTFFIVHKNLTSIIFKALIYPIFYSV